MREELDQVIEEIDGGKRSPLYLIVGDEFWVRQDADELVAKLVPKEALGLNHVTLDGSSPQEIAADLATLPMFPGPKVVLCRDPEFLLPKKSKADALGRVKDAWRAGRRKEAARRVLALISRAGWDAKALRVGQPGAPSKDRWRDELSIDLSDEDVAILIEIAAFCEAEAVAAPATDLGPLLSLLERGIPQGHSLILAASEIDPKHPLVKWADQHGRVLARREVVKLKEVDLSELAQTTLRPLGKRLSPSAATALKDRCGANFRQLKSELEKLALYVEGSTIELTHVEQLVERTRDEEFFELSEAVQRRNLPAALRYVDDAIGRGAHPLLLLGSIASVVRTVLENHERWVHLANRKMPKGFDAFKSEVFPLIEQESKERKGRLPHPYAAFMAMQAGASFTRGELLAALVACADADASLKTSANGRLVIERLLFTVCGRA